MTVKHTPSTQLPWEWLPDDGQFIATPEPERKIIAEVPCQGCEAQDGAYVVHAANAYPKMVEALRIALLAWEKPNPTHTPAYRKKYERLTGLLRDLGEVT